MTLILLAWFLARWTHWQASALRYLISRLAHQAPFACLASDQAPVATKNQFALNHHTGARKAVVCLSRALDSLCARRGGGAFSFSKGLAMLDIYKVSLKVARTVGVAGERIAVHDKDLARQMRRSMASIILNIAEGVL